MTTRRSLIVAAGALLSAGCIEEGAPVGPTDRVATTSPDDEASAGTSTFTVDQHTGGPRSPAGCSAGFDVTARQVDVAEWLPTRLDAFGALVVVQAVGDGDADFTQYGETPPVPDGAYVEHEGAYYETTVERLGTTEVPALVMNVEWEAGRTPPDDAEVVAFGDLPAVDRDALTHAVYGAEGSDEERGHPSESLRVRDAPVPYPDGTADSRLAGGDTTWVHWRNHVYEVWTAGETTTTRYRFRVDVTAVAADAQGFRELVADRHLVALSDLSDAERDVLETAVGGTYEACEDDDGVVALRERLDEDDRLPQPRNGNWYVDFRGSRYALRIYHWTH